jgi:hypothetical protein
MHSSNKFDIYWSVRKYTGHLTGECWITKSEEIFELNDPDKK